MNWNAHPESDGLYKNVTVMMFDFLIDGEPAPSPAVGDILTIEYPCNARAAGVITSVSSERIEVEVNNNLSSWKLVDSNQNNGKITLTYVVC